MRALSNRRQNGFRLAASVAAAAIALSLSACGGDDVSTGGNEQISVGSTTSLAGVGVRNGIASGEFKDAGLNVAATPVKSGNDAVPQLISGKLQVAQVDTTTALQAIEKGVPIKIVAAAGVQSTDGGAGVPSTGSLLVKPDSAIKSIEDLAGKKIGIHAINSQIWMNIRSAIDLAGGKSETSKFIEVPGPQAIDMLDKGEVEVTTASEPMASAAVASGAVRLIHSTDVPGRKGEPSSVYISTTEYVEQDTESLGKFADAIYKAQDAVNKDKDLGKKIAVEQLDYTNGQLKSAFILDYGTHAIDPSELESVAQMAVDFGVLKEVPKADEVLAQLP